MLFSIFKEFEKHMHCLHVGWMCVFFLCLSVLFFAFVMLTYLITNAKAKSGWAATNRVVKQGNRLPGDIVESPPDWRGSWAIYCSWDCEEGDWSKGPFQPQPFHDSLIFLLSCDRGPNIIHAKIYQIFSNSDLKKVHVKISYHLLLYFLEVR